MHAASLPISSISTESYPSLVLSVNFHSSYSASKELFLLMMACTDPPKPITQRITIHSQELPDIDDWSVEISGYCQDFPASYFCIYIT